MSFDISTNLVFINSFQFPSSSLDRFVKNLGKDDFKYLSQEFASDVLDLGFYPNEHMRSLKNNYQAKRSFIVC